MENKKLGYEDFIAAVDGGCKEFVEELHRDFTGHGCKIEVKSSKSGYLVSYSLNKKTAANFVFRKKGVFLRLYANHLSAYMELLETLPDGMVKTIREAPDCKRLLDPNACNPRCPMGYDFLLRGERHQKCRNNAFLFLVCGETAPFLRSLVKGELAAAVGAD